MGTMNRVIETISTNEEEEKEEINGDVEKETQPLPDIVDVVSQKEACARCGETRKRPCSPIEPERELNLIEDIDCDSICATVSQLIKSHLHRAAGGCRHIQDDIVIWMDFDYSLIKKSRGVREEVVPWKTDGQGYKGSYSMRVTRDGWKYGLAPAMQTLVFESQHIIKQLGLNLITIKNDFKQTDGTDWPGVEGENSTMKIVVMRYDKIIGPCKKNLKLNTTL